VTRGHLMASLGGRVSPSSLDRFLRKLQKDGAIQKTRHGEYKAPQALVDVLVA
jgi:DNA-binding PadR family transcriptional regulator